MDKKPVIIDGVKYLDKDFDSLKELTNMRAVAEPWLDTINAGDIRGARVWQHKANRIMDQAKDDRNLSEEIRQWIEDHVEGAFTARAVYDSLHLRTREEKKLASKVFINMKDKKLLEKGKGCWMKIDANLIPIEWWKPKKKTFDLLLPLGIHEVARVFPKNLIVASGQSNAGKSAFCLATAIMNMDTYNINYFNSEMAEEEFSDRLDVCDLSSGQLATFRDKVKIWERGFKFEQVIEPNGFNIIDYLTTPADKAYLMKDAIEVISDKLDKGIALIAIHKKKNEDHGYGGVYTMNRPRVYISINHGIVKLVKVKAWQKGLHNPNGKIMNFKLVNGWDFRPQTVWHREGELESAVEDKENIKENRW